MSDYDQQPPPSTGTLVPSSGGLNHPSGLPATGSDLAPIVGWGLLLSTAGAVLVALAHRARRRGDPWADAERARQRDWDRLARHSKDLP